MTWDMESTITPQAFSDLSLAHSLHKLKLQSKSKNDTQKKIANLLLALDQIMQEKGVVAESPTAMMGVLLTLLDQHKELTDNTCDITAASYLLALVLPRVPVALLKSKSTDLLRIIGQLLNTRQDDVSTTRSLIACLETVMLHLEASLWTLPAVKSAYQSMFILTTDERLKVRRRANETLRKILSMPPPPTMTHPAAKFTGEIITRLMADLIDSDVNALIHLLAFLRLIVDYLSDAMIEQLCDKLFVLPQQNNTIVTLAVFQVFRAVFIAKGATWNTSKLVNILEALPDLKPHYKDAVLSVAWLECFASGLFELSKSASSLCSARLSSTVDEHIFPFLQSSQMVVVNTATQMLIELMHRCIPTSMINQAVTLAATPMQNRTERSELEKLIVTVEMGLSVRYRDAWPSILLILKALLVRLGAHGVTLMKSGIELLGEFRNQEDFPYTSQLDEVLGAAISSMGPEAFLQMLPLNLEQAGATDVDIRTYLLPLLAKNIRYTQLEFFVRYFFSVIDHLKRKQEEYMERERAVEAKLFEVLLSQVWALLPGFCTYPLDLKESFRLIGPRMGEVLRDNPTLRSVIAASLHLLISKNLELTKMPESSIPIELVDRGYSLDVAQNNVRGVAVSAKFFLPLLFNIYKEMDPETRGYIGSLIAEFVIIADVEVLSTLYTQLMTSLLQPTLPAPIQHALFDLALYLLQRLPPSAVTPLYTVVMSTLSASTISNVTTNGQRLINKNVDVDATQQKKCYKVLARMCEIESVKQVLRQSLDDITKRVMLDGMLQTGGGGAKKARLQFLLSIVEHILNPDPKTCADVVAILLPEAIEATKEVNEKSRTLAFELLIAMGQLMLRVQDQADANRAPINGNDVFMDSGHSIEVYVKMVAAGLVATTPHFISATMLALARLVFEYKDMLSSNIIKSLMDNICLFSASDNRQIAKSVFAFFKIALTVLSVQDIQGHLQKMIVTALTLSGKHGATYKVNVRHLLQRLTREVSIEAVEAVIPEAHKKLIANIRKRRERTMKRKEKERIRRDHIKDHNDCDSADDERTADKTRKGRRGKSFGNAFEDVVYESESDEEDDPCLKEDSDIETLLQSSRSDQNHSNTTKKRSRGAVEENRAWIKEDVDGNEDALDFLDSKVVSKVLSMNPRLLNQKRQQQRSKSLSADFEIAADGRLVIAESDDEQKTKNHSSKIIKGDPSISNETVNGENHYLELMRSVDGFTGGGGTKVRFGKTNKRRAEDGESDQQIPDEEETAVRKKTKRVKQEVPRVGQEYRSKRAGGDVKRAGQPDPFAYIPLTARIVGNKQKKSIQVTTGGQRITGSVQGGRRKGGQQKKHKK